MLKMHPQTVLSFSVEPIFIWKKDLIFTTNISLKTRSLHREVLHLHLLLLTDSSPTTRASITVTYRSVSTIIPMLQSIHLSLTDFETGKASNLKIDQVIRLWCFTPVVHKLFEPGPLAYFIWGVGLGMQIVVSL